MNLRTVIKAFDALVALRDAAKGFTSVSGQGDADLREAEASALQPGGGQIEARLTNVVVAALREAFDRDHARLELERAQLEEQRRRAEDAMRMELLRQAADREIGRLRLLSGVALVGWIASIALLVVRLGAASTPSRVILALGWLLLLAALAAAFSAQARVGAHLPDRDRLPEVGAAGAATLWLLIAGLAVSAGSLLL